MKRRDYTKEFKQEAVALSHRQGTPEAAELLQIIARDEDSQHQFKANVSNETALAQEMVAFSNTLGGQIIIGVSDDGSISGLSRADMGRLSNLVSNAASQQVRPPINPITHNLELPEGLVMVVQIPAGIARPYMDKNGVIWVKNGPDKRRATSREEIQRMYQRAGLIHSDEVPVNHASLADLDLIRFADFYEQQYGESLAEQTLPLPQVLENLNLSREGQPNLAGMLLFGKHNPHKLPAFVVKCVVYPGDDIDLEVYQDSQDISGPLKSVFDDALGFLMRNTRQLQNGQNVNSLGEPQIPRLVYEELLANALIHRDYFVSAPIRIFMFANRIEIISPGHLPNNLTIENIKYGNSNIRNPILASFATKILPYRGLGNGIRRALKAYPQLDFVDDREANLFKVILFTGQPNAAASLGEKLDETQSAMLMVIAANPKVTIKNLAESLNLSTTAIEKNLKQLKQHQRIRRVGPAKGGHWEVIRNK